MSKNYPFSLWTACKRSTWVNILSYFPPLAAVNSIWGYTNNRPTPSTYYFPPLPKLLCSMTNSCWMPSYRATRNHEWMPRHSHIDKHMHTPCLPPSILVFLVSSLSSPPLPLSFPLSLTPRHTRKKNRKRERERKQHRDRARRRTGKGSSCAVLPLHSFLLGWSFPSGGERDCKLSKRTVRKQEAPSSSRESKMKSIWGPCSPGRLGGHC